MTKDLNKQYSVMREMYYVGDNHSVSRPDYFSVQGGRIKRWLEIKCRTNVASRYPTYMISLDKLLIARHFYNTTGIPTFLAVRFRNKDMWIKLTGKGSRLNSDFLFTHTEIGGRFDRGDKQDVEPVCQIPMKYFRNLQRPMKKSS